MRKMIALMSFSYCGRGIGSGHSFDCEDKDVQVLIQFGRAKLVPEVAQEYQTRDMVARGRRKAAA